MDFRRLDKTKYTQIILQSSLFNSENEETSVARVEVDRTPSSKKPDGDEKTLSGKPAKIVLKTPYRMQDEIERKTPSSRKSESDQKQAASVLKTPHKQVGCVMKSSGSAGSNSDESCTPKRKVGIRRGKSNSKEASKHINRCEEGEVSTDVEDSNDEMAIVSDESFEDFNGVIDEIDSSGYVIQILKASSL